jgi:hypothetical protein
VWLLAYHAYIPANVAAAQISIPTENAFGETWEGPIARILANGLFVTKSLVQRQRHATPVPGLCCIGSAWLWL